MIVYEKATEDDLKQLTGIYISYVLEEFEYLTDEEYKDLCSSVPDYFTRVLNKTMYAYLARDGKRVITCAMMLVVENPANPELMNGLIGNMLCIYTVPDYRNRGYARHVMEGLIDDCHDMGIKLLEIKAPDSGRHLYRELGFIRCGNACRLMKCMVY